MISCSKCKKATLPVSDGGCIKTGGIVDIGCENGEPRILTNYDRLHAMGPEELAGWFIKIQDDVADYYDGGHAYAPELPTMKNSWLDWLKQEVET